MTVIELANLSDASYSNKQAVKVDIRHRKMVPVGSAVKPVGFDINAFSTAMSTPAVMPGMNQTLMRWEETTEKVEWKLKTTWSNAVGFSASFYEKGKEQVLAFRGTDDLFDGLVDDAMIGLGAAPMQALAALVVAQVGGLKQSAYITGHSLGGALAVIAAAQTGRAAVTFNAPGVMDSCMLVSGVGLSKGVKGLFEMMARCVANARVWNVRIGGDVVSSKLTTGSQPGRTKVITAAECGYNALCLHSMSTILGKMGEPEYNEALEL